MLDLIRMMRMGEYCLDEVGISGQVGEEGCMRGLFIVVLCSVSIGVLGI